MMAYPNRSHAIREGTNTTIHLRQLMTSFLKKNLPVEPVNEAVQPQGEGDETKETSKVARRDAFVVEHEVRRLEGWTVQVDKRLLAGSAARLGEVAMKLLVAKFRDVVFGGSGGKTSDPQKGPDLARSESSTT